MPLASTPGFGITSGDRSMSFMYHACTMHGPFLEIFFYFSFSSYSGFLADINNLAFTLFFS